jgi:hypothetical protein
MPREDVDGASVSVDRERHFRDGRPGRKLPESAGDQLVHGRVPSAQESIELAALPPDDGVPPGTKRSGDAAQSVEGHRADLTLLDPSDRPPRRSRPNRELVLAPVPANSERPDGGANAVVVHQPIMALDHSPVPIARALPTKA